MRILGIESSCDETAAAVVQDGRIVLQSRVASTKEIFSNAGGVVPEDAARRQVECVLPVLHATMSGAGLTYADIDAIAVTRGPGLLGSLLVGTTAARTLSVLHDIPLIGVHHTFGHLSSVWLEHEPAPTFPSITLSASGGHTDLWYRISHTKGYLIGRTRDDAAGEAFDKGARMLDLPYPGGPSIAAAAEKGEENAFAFPKALAGDDSLDFSFSGVKTALRYTIRDLTSTLDSVRDDLAASYQHALCTQLSDRILRALELYSDVREVHIVGGVSANTRLRSMLTESLGDITLQTPAKISYCTDNAAMIAAGGFFLTEELGPQAYDECTTEAVLPLDTCLRTP